MLVIGICGQTGAGKSTLADLLSRHGLGRNLEVDAIGHELLTDPQTIKKLVGVFGDEILDDKKNICRRSLGRRAFVDSETTARLNEIMHPAMIDRVRSEIDFARKHGARGLIVNAALLFSMGLSRMCDVVIYVRADAEIRLKRLVELRNWTESSARERLFAQDEMPDDPLIIAVENNAGSSELEVTARALSAKLERMIQEGK